MGRPRILHAPADVGGHAYGLSRGERELGLVSDVAVLAAGPYGYGADIRLDLTDLPTPQVIRRRAAFARHALARYDVIHLNFGHPIVAVRRGPFILSELPLLKRAGKTVIVTFQGCDVRPQAACACTSPVCAAQDPKRLPNARHMLRYADRVYHLNPDLRRWLPGSRFLPYASVDIRATTPAPLTMREELVVAHGPTNREVKGTEHVIAAVDALRGEGVAVRLDLVEGATRREALARFGTADVIVDQLRLGWYGGLAVEGMALGRPVLAAIAEDDPADNPFGSALPIVRTSPESLRDDLRELLADRARRERMSAEGRAFVERHHDPRAVAQAILDDLP
ncbi:MAG TPA: glycosyltransferase [Solirubrobacteraceae bacterium]|nr:glycosyltransferase [Solirubrobacteraceae bacterium]